MKALIALILLFSTSAHALWLHTPKINVDTKKVTTIQGVINDRLAYEFIRNLRDTAELPGPRILLITSPGGSVDVGNRMIAAIELERSLGVKYVCVALDDAASMAFNLLTHCDMRLASVETRFTVHKIALDSWPQGLRGTTKNLREIALDLEKEDEPFRRLNAQAMHLTLKQYDKYADAETEWTAKQLLKMHYLDGFVRIKQ